MSEDRSMSPTGELPGAFSFGLIWGFSWVEKVLGVALGAERKGTQTITVPNLQISSRRGEGRKVMVVCKEGRRCEVIGRASSAAFIAGQETIPEIERG